MNVVNFALKKSKTLFLRMHNVYPALPVGWDILIYFHEPQASELLD